MAGIMANSVSATMIADDTAEDNSSSGYIDKERITLTVTGSGDSFLWSLSKPATSGLACSLASTDQAATTFVPDADGYYVITCLVNGTTLYVLRIGVAQVSVVSSLTALRLVPVANSLIPSPAVGATIFYSADLDGVAKKLPNGTVSLL